MKTPAQPAHLPCRHGARWHPGLCQRSQSAPWVSSWLGAGPEASPASAGPSRVHSRHGPGHSACGAPDEGAGREAATPAGTGRSPWHESERRYIAESSLPRGREREKMCVYESKREKEYREQWVNLGCIGYILSRVKIL